MAHHHGTGVQLDRHFGVGQRGTRSNTYSRELSSRASKSSSSSSSSASQVIHDTRGKRRYLRGRMLGKGGFARCFEMTDVSSGDLFAGKIVQKKTLAKYRAKEKLITEIKIHSSLCHEHVVGFRRFFEDDSNVYILLEVCASQTMMELHKRRRTLTEPEVRFYLKQTVEGTQYMHSRKIIHRDLKLGNLFLDKNLQIKIGDFGLAARVEYEGERKRTLCGTPNYIAPEILDTGAGGHSYEVDIWSIGCILYTVLVGRPPFETQEIKETYQKIRLNDYYIPSTANVSREGRRLIKWALAAKPKDRPTLDEILSCEFFQGFIPDSLPKSSLTKIPVFKEGQSTRTPLGSVDVNSPVQISKSKSTKAGLRPSGLSQAPVERRTLQKKEEDYPKRLISVNHRHSLMSVLHSLKKWVAQQAAAEDPETPSPVPDKVAAQAVWISKWVDYSNKYGLGYQLSDGSVGVLFNDSTKMILSPDQSKIESIQRTSEGQFVTHLTLQNYPSQLEKNVTLLKYFESYMNEHLLNGGDDPLHGKAVKDTGTDEMCHIKKWTRTKHAIVFRLSQGIVQINFFDHAKVVINSPLELITFINKSRKISTYRAADIAKTCTTDENVADLIHRLPYAVEVVNQMIKPV
eukprot:m.4533 g.4533  ORF g.4533 m.4533 type:complete len:630 (+) comp3010_c0_seq1:293-2182(+)